MSYKSLNLILLRRDEQISGYSAALPLSSVYSRFSLNESYSCGSRRGRMDRTHLL